MFDDGRRLNAQTDALSREELKRRIISKLSSRGLNDPTKVTDGQLYAACYSVIKDIMLENRERFKKRARLQGAKKICYLCMEFLVGRGLHSDSVSLGIYEALCEAIVELGSSFERVYSAEPDPGLGNGGLGRLAACFMGSLSSLGYYAGGYSLLYENGLFKQRIIDGEQIELPDVWIPTGGVRLVPKKERAVTVRFGGRIEERWENGLHSIDHIDYDEVIAVPYDLLIPGKNGVATNTIRLWRAVSPKRSEEDLGKQENYVRLTGNAGAEAITKQLYPPDNFDEGKLLRLSQQYLLVSASLQSILADHLSEHGSLDGFAEKTAIHINDTHPALCIPELMRILMDVYSYSWESAWEIVVRTVSYTNHTVLPEALECWREDLFSLKLPRIYMIVKEINKRFTADLWELYPGDWDRISRMSVTAYGQIRMANLSVVASHSVNGVSRLHSDILKRSVFHDFYKMTPWKFTNVTNGVNHRRWLLDANPELSNLIDGSIGTEYRRDPTQLSELRRYCDDRGMLSEFMRIKRKNKLKFADYAMARYDISVDPDSIFDVQIKRMHEYKRQLLNALKIILRYVDICDGVITDRHPETYIFGCKAAPGYDMAKRLIKLLWCLSREIESNPRAKDVIKVCFLEDYNVSVAEKLIPASDISEQISLAGKEASGTGCMKLMMNGAVTLGTLDGANVEIKEACGDENIYIFGLNSREVDELWNSGYNSYSYYHGSERVRRAVDRLCGKIGGEDFSFIAEYLLRGGRVADPFMCLADLDSYVYAHDIAVSDYSDRNRWARRALINTATSGVFSSDVSIRKYAEEIWHTRPVTKK